MANPDDLRELVRRLEELRVQRKSLSNSTRSEQAPDGYESWRTRAIVAENRVQDLEEMLQHERESRNRLVNQKTKIEGIIIAEREKHAQEVLELTIRDKDWDGILKHERRRSRKLIETYDQKLSVLSLSLSQQATEIEEYAKSTTELEHELAKVIEDRNELLGENEDLRMKLAELEDHVIPKGNEDRMRLQIEVQQLKGDLEESIQSEAAFRSLFLQQQDAKLRRRQRRDDPASTLNPSDNVILTQ
jgi:chromosome segregation ATPase